MVWKRGDKVVLGMAEYPPYTNPCGVWTLHRTPECPRPGIINEIMALVFEMAKIEYEMVFYPDDADWGTLHKDKGRPCYWTGVLGDIWDGKIHTQAGDYAYIEERTNCFIFTNPINYEENVLVFKATSDLSQNFYALVRVFDSKIWMISLAIVMMLTLFLALNNKVFAVEEEEIEKSYPRHMAGAFWQIMQMISDQASTIPTLFSQTTHTARYLMSMMGIFALFFLRLYENGLLTSLLLQNEVMPFRNIYELADLVGQGKAQYMLNADTFLEALLVNSNISVFDTMRVATSSNPHIGATYFGKALQQVRDAKAGKIGYSTPFFSVREELEKDCELKFFFDKDLPITPSAFIFNSTDRLLVDILNENINKIMDFHFGFILRKYFTTNPPKDCVPAEAMLTQDNFLGLYILSSLIVALSLAAFAFELYLVRRRGNQMVSWTNPPKDCVPAEAMLTQDNFLGLYILSSLIVALSLAAFAFELYLVRRRGNQMVSWTNPPKDCVPAEAMLTQDNFLGLYILSSLIVALSLAAFAFELYLVRRRGNQMVSWTNPPKDCVPAEAMLTQDNFLGLYILSSLIVALSLAAFAFELYLVRRRGNQMVSWTNPPKDCVPAEAMLTQDNFLGLYILSSLIVALSLAAFAFELYLVRRRGNQMVSWTNPPKDCVPAEAMLTQDNFLGLYILSSLIVALSLAAFAFELYLVRRRGNQMVSWTNPPKDCVPAEAMLTQDNFLGLYILSSLIVALSLAAFAFELYLVRRRGNQMVSWTNPPKDCVPAEAMLTQDNFLGLYILSSLIVALSLAAFAFELYLVRRRGNQMVSWTNPPKDCVPAEAMLTQDNFLGLYILSSLIVALSLAAFAFELYLVRRRGNQMVSWTNPPKDCVPAEAMLTQDNFLGLYILSSPIVALSLAAFAFELYLVRRRGNQMVSWTNPPKDCVPAEAMLTQDNFLGLYILSSLIVALSLAAFAFELYLVRRRGNQMVSWTNPPKNCVPAEAMLTQDNFLGLYILSSLIVALSLAAFAFELYLVRRRGNQMVSWTNPPKNCVPAEAMLTQDNFLGLYILSSLIVALSLAAFAFELYLVRRRGNQMVSWTNPPKDCVPAEAMLTQDNFLGLYILSSLIVALSLAAFAFELYLVRRRGNQMNYVCLTSWVNVEMKKNLMAQVPPFRAEFQRPEVKNNMYVLDA